MYTQEGRTNNWQAYVRAILFCSWCKQLITAMHTAQSLAPCLWVACCTQPAQTDSPAFAWSKHACQYTYIRRTDNQQSKLHVRLLTCTALLCVMLYVLRMCVWAHVRAELLTCTALLCVMLHVLCMCVWAYVRAELLTCTVLLCVMLYVCCMCVWSYVRDELLTCTALLCVMLHVSCMCV